MEIYVKSATHEIYARYYTVYVRENIFMRFHWNDRLKMISEDKSCYFLYNGSEIIGGFVLDEGRIIYPFLAQLSFGWEQFFRECLSFEKVKDGPEARMGFIQEGAAECLLRDFNGSIKMHQRIMVRPTDILRRELHDDFYFSQIHEEDFDEIIDIVYISHKNGYTNNIYPAERESIKSAIRRRFDLFAQTESLGLGCTVRCKERGEIAGVCIAGIYPDSPDDFSTINQVSVSPKNRGRGIASAMIARCITNASEVSPVITLGVMVGNPAERLYESLGFISRSSYYELLVNRAI